MLDLGVNGVQRVLDGKCTEEIDNYVEESMQNLEKRLCDTILTEEPQNDMM